MFQFQNEFVFKGLSLAGLAAQEPSNDPNSGKLDCEIRVLFQYSFVRSDLLVNQTLEVLLHQGNVQLESRPRVTAAITAQVSAVSQPVSCRPSGVRFLCVDRLLNTSAF